MHLSKADAKHLEGLGILPEKPKKPNRYAPYRSKWEQDYAIWLAGAVADEEIAWWWYERVTYTLVPSSDHQRGVRYTPDFIVANADGSFEIHEVKGHWRPGAKHKVKALAAMLKPIPVYVVRKVEGQWTKERF
jgi:hypothetical protein